MQKKIFSEIIVVLSLLFYFTGCAHKPTTTPEEPAEKKPQEIVVKVEAVDPTKITIEDGVKIVKSMSVANPEIRLSGLTSISNDVSFVCLFSGLNQADVKNLWNDLIYLYTKTGYREINLFMNSRGGNAFSGLALADLIEMAKLLGFTVKAHAFGIIASAAVPVFAVCDVRLAAPGTMFMVHEAAVWKPQGKTTAAEIEAEYELMRLLRDRYIGILINNSKLNKTKWNELEKKTTWFSANKAQEWGLVQEVTLKPLIMAVQFAAKAKITLPAQQ